MRETAPPGPMTDAFAPYCNSDRTLAGSSAETMRLAQHDEVVHAGGNVLDGKSDDC